MLISLSLTSVPGKLKKSAVPSRVTLKKRSACGTSWRERKDFSDLMHRNAIWKSFKLDCRTNKNNEFRICKQYQVVISYIGKPAPTSQLKIIRRPRLSLVYSCFDDLNLFGPVRKTSNPWQSVPSAVSFTSFCAQASPVLPLFLLESSFLGYWRKQYFLVASKQNRMELCSCMRAMEITGTIFVLLYAYHFGEIIKLAF